MDLRLEFDGVSNSKSRSVSEVVQIWGKAGPLVVAAAVELLRTAKGFPDVELKVTNNGVSGYGQSTSGRRAECFHIGVNSSKNQIVIYQHGNARDTKGMFPNSAKSTPNSRYGYLTEATLGQVHDAGEVIRNSYLNITGL
jgi:hypothetical protein